MNRQPQQMQPFAYNVISWFIQMSNTQEIGALYVCVCVCVCGCVRHIFSLKNLLKYSSENMIVDKDKFKQHYQGNSQRDWMLRINSYRSIIVHVF